MFLCLQAPKLCPVVLISAVLRRRWVRSNGGMILTGKNEVMGEKPVTAPLCPPWISHELAWDWSQASWGKGLVTNHLSHGMTCKDCSSSFCKYQCIQWKYRPDNAVKGNTLFIVTVTQIHKTYRVDMKSFRMSEQTVHWPGSRNVYLIHPYRKNYATEICGVTEPSVAYLSH